MLQLHGFELNPEVEQIMPGKTVDLHITGKIQNAVLDEFINSAPDGIFGKRQGLGYEFV
jgi:hypothetical protein